MSGVARVTRRPQDIVEVISDHETEIRRLRRILARIGDAANALDDLTDVTITAVGTGEVLLYTGAGWENQTLAEAGISSDSHVHATYLPKSAGPSEALTDVLYTDSTPTYPDGIWGTSQIALYPGSIGHMGSHRLGLAYNFQRGASSGYDGLDVNSNLDAYGFELGPGGFFFFGDSVYAETGHPSEMIRIGYASELSLDGDEIDTTGPVIWMPFTSSDGGLWFDDDQSKRITWNDGGGNFNILGHTYHGLDFAGGGSATDRFLTTGNGAFRMDMRVDNATPTLYLEFADGTGHNAGDAITWDTTYTFEWNGQTIIEGVASATQLQIRGTQDAGSGTNNSGLLVLGPSGSTQLRLDQNEIQAANNTATSTLYLNNDGGEVRIGGHTSPNSDNSYDLGTSSLSWRRLYAYALYDETGAARLDLSQGAWFTTWRPDADSSNDLGTSSFAWRTLYVGDDSQNGAGISWQQERTWTLYQRSTGASSYAEWQSSSNKTWVFGGVTSGEMLQIFHTTSSSVLALRDALTDVGNHETLRLNRGSGSSIQSVGYYSSRAVDEKTGRALKGEITNASEAAEMDYAEVGPARFSLGWIDTVEPRFYRRRTTAEAMASPDGMSGWEFGFLLEDLADTSPYLTTKPGETIGYSPDEMAIMATMWAAIKDLRKRVLELEAK